MQNTPQNILRRVFGYETFRPLQADIISSVLSGKDTLVIMPTGGGKSLCYQIPALAESGMTLVVSPLISLMKDQVEQLLEAGVPAVYLNSSLPVKQYNDNFQRVKAGKVKLLYLAPETLMKPGMLEILAGLSVKCIAIDEAHCISEWGHDFRPEYRQITVAREFFPKAVCIALTATATKRVREDIKKSLNFTESRDFIGSFDRKNLFLRVIPKKNPEKQVLSFLKKTEGQSGIIYCFSRNQVESLSDFLKWEGFSVKPYHAGLSDKERRENQERFIRDDVQIIVATVAFGMGINKPNVRFVIHYDLPKNIEGYYQEIGRAGRDGLRAECLLLLGYGDIRKIRYFIDQKTGLEKRVAENHLQAMLRYAETDVCRRRPLLGYFGESYERESCAMCDNCFLDKKSLTDMTVPAQKFLSCVKRSGERFGASHVVDILRGSEAKKIFKFSHQHLSTYGIGKDFSKEQWMDLSRQLLHKGYMAQDMTYGTLQLTDKAWQLFRGEDTFMGRMTDVAASAVQPAKEGPASPEDLAYDKTLFDLLRQKRKSLADEGKVPPYVIFPDRTLIEIAARFPQRVETFGQVYGVGDQKLKKYAASFLKVICDYCEKRHIPDQLAEKAETFERPPQYGNRKPRHIEVGELFNQGLTAEQLMEKYNVKLQTVLDHLSKFCLEGNTLNAGNLRCLHTISPEDQRKVYEAFENIGFELLGPVFRAVDEKISYDNLKILRLLYLASERK